MTSDIIEATETTVQCVAGEGVGMVQDQPAPKPNTLPAIWDLVIEEMRHRDRIGRQRYGTPLQPFNGRDALTDAFQEALDLVVYLRQAIYEREQKATEAACTVAWVDPTLMRAALMDAFETLRLSGGRRPDAPYAWDRAELADELSVVLAGEMGKRIQ